MVKAIERDLIAVYLRSSVDWEDGITVKALERTFDRGLFAFER